MNGMEGGKGGMEGEGRLAVEAGVAELQVVIQGSIGVMVAA